MSTMLRPQGVRPFYPDTKEYPVRTRTSLSVAKRAQLDYVKDVLGTSMQTWNSENERKFSSPAKYFAFRFNSEFNCEYYRRQYPSAVERVAEYIKGLTFDFAYEYGEILSLGNSWGYLSEHSRAFTQERFCNRWWTCISVDILRLCRAEGIDFNKGGYND